MNREMRYSLLRVMGCWKKYSYSAIFQTSLCFFIAGNVSAQSFIADLVIRSSPSLVVIETRGEEGPQRGYGFLVTSDGTLITNYHLVKGASEIQIKLEEGSMYIIEKLLSYNEKYDIAKLKLGSKRNNFPFLRISSEKVDVGGKIVVLHGGSIIKDGIVSGISSLDDFGDVIQISVPLSMGSLGCPVIDTNGEVVGMVVSTSIEGQMSNVVLPGNLIIGLLERVQ